MHAPRAVRAALSQLAGLGWILGDVMLIASELVDNAVLHSACTDNDFLEVRLSSAQRLRLRVIDPGGSGRVAKIVERPIELGGLGLKIVDQLADDWGSHRGDEGHEVWVELGPPSA
jgi:anti-sigma regulatory factor (Ser/Thr protein kinase)